MRTIKKEFVLAKAALAYADMAKTASPCGRAKHACVITDRNLVPISCGYNGPPKGFFNQCRGPNEPGKCLCVHAEANALIKAQRNVNSRIAFITGHPCDYCACLIVNAGIEIVIYAGAAHRSYDSGQNVLNVAGIKHGTLDEMVVYL